MAAKTKVKWFSDIRVLVFLRRIAKALEERNRLERIRLATDHPELAREIGAQRKRSKPVEFSVATAEDYNERWKNEHPDEAS